MKLSLRGNPRTLNHLPVVAGGAAGRRDSNGRLALTNYKAGKAFRQLNSPPWRAGAKLSRLVHEAMLHCGHDAPPRGFAAVPAVCHALFRARVRRADGGA